MATESSRMATISEATAIAIQHHQAGRLQTAEEIYRLILQADPDHAEALQLLGVIASQMGQHEMAVEHISRAIGLNGKVTAFHNNLGEAYRALGRIPEAAACYRRALKLEPNDAVACNNLGVVLNSQGRSDEAIDCYRRALNSKPNYAEAHNNLGNAFKAKGQLDEAVACFRRALNLKPDVAEMHNNVGVVWNKQGKLDQAVACYRRALELKPDYAAAHHNLGITLEQIGDLQGAEDCFRAALRFNSRLAVAHGKLARLLGGKLPENDLTAQRRLLEETGLTDAERLSLHFGLAQVLDAGGKYAEAAAHLERGNALQLAEWRKRGRGYNPKEHEDFVTGMIAACTPDFFQRVRGYGLESEVPVFVMGLPRSGTTLIEQILASHSRVFGAGEISLVGNTLAALGEPGADCIARAGSLDRPTARRLASRHLEILRDLDRAALRIVDKTPENYLYLGLLASLFPRAKWIHCRRDLRDVAVSCWMTPFEHLRAWANDQQHIASRFHEHQRIMEHWRKVLPVPMLEVDYEETVADLEGVARKLVAWCGLAWEPACVAFHAAKRPVTTASAVQVRQSVYRTSVGRWKHYEQALSPLFARLKRDECSVSIRW